MNQYATMIRNLKSPEVMERLMHLYGRRDGMLVEQTGRYIGLLKRHEELFHENREVLMISAPAARKLAATTPTTTAGVCWRRQSTWIRCRRFPRATI